MFSFAQNTSFNDKCEKITMPERGIPENHFIKAARKNREKLARNQPPLVTTVTTKELARMYNKRFIGVGRESVVVAIPGSDKKILAFSFKKLDPFRAKEMYYLQKIFSTLFPHNFPKVYASFSEDEKKKRVSGTVREYVRPLMSKYGIVETIVTSEKGKKIKYPFSHALRILNNLGIPLNIDAKSDNFVVGDDGGEYYVEPVKRFQPFLWQSGKRESILRFMEYYGYSSRDMRVVSHSIDRLFQLYEEFLDTKKSGNR